MISELRLQFKNNVQDKLLLLSYRIHTTTKEFGFNEDYYKSDKAYKYAMIPKNEDIYANLRESEGKEKENKEKEEEDDPIPIQNYVSIKNPKDKFKKSVKKLMIDKNFPKNIITEINIKEHMDNSKNSGTPNKINNLMNQKRLKMATFGTPKITQKP